MAINHTKASLPRLYSILSRAITHEGGFTKLCLKFTGIILKEGFKGISLRINHLQIMNFQENLSIKVSDSLEESINYQVWLDRYVNEAYQGDMQSLLVNKPLISIVCPIYNPNIADLDAAITSVLNQEYGNWELCLADDNSSTFDLSHYRRKYRDKRIKCIRRKTNGNISESTNTAIEMASGEFICFLDQDDLLAEKALFWIAAAINKNPNLKFIYSDEDKINDKGQRCDPNFKPDWNYHYLLSRNYICHLAVYESQLLKSLGGCQLGMEGAQDYDLILRASEVLKDDEIYHIPRILYHWRKHPDSTSENPLAKPYALVAGEKALEEHINRGNIKATVNTNFIGYVVEFECLEPAPKVSIIIPTRNQLGLLRTCINSIKSTSDYTNFEIIIINNNSDDQDILNYFTEFEKDENQKVIHDDQTFNFARLMNGAVKDCQSELVLFLNNDIEVISKNWLSEMVAVINQKKVGIVGAKLLYSDETIQHAGVILGVGGVAGHAHKYFPNGHPGYVNRLESRQELSAVTGACLLTRKSTFESVSGMDEENLAIAFNDIDYCLKVSDLGLKVVWTPFSILYHHESKSRGLEDTISKQKRYSKEIETMQDRWGDRLKNDPAYNPNLTLSYENFSIAPWSRNTPVENVIEALEETPS